MGYEDLAFENWLSSGRDKMEAAGKHQIDDDVPIDEAAMLSALKDAREWQMQLDADVESLTTEWTDYKEQDECYGE